MAVPKRGTFIKVRVTDDEAEQFHALAARTSRTMSDMIRQLVASEWDRLTRKLEVRR